MTTSDAVKFSKDDEYTITLDATITNADFSVTGGDVTFDLGGETYTSTTKLQAAPENDQKANVTVRNGVMDFKNVSSVMAGGARSEVSFRLEGAGTELKSSTAHVLNLGDSYTSKAELFLGEGTKTEFNQYWIGRYGAGKLVASNATLRSNNKNNIYVGSYTGSGELDLIGPSTLLDNIFDVRVGVSGKGRMTVAPGVSIKTTYLHIGYNTSSDGVLTLNGSRWECVLVTLGEPHDIGVPLWGYTYKGGGKGALELLDGSTVKTTGISGTPGRTFYVGPRTGVRIRDSWIDSTRNNSAMLFRTDSWLAVELTGQSFEKASDSTPLIYSRASTEDSKTNTIETGVAFNLELTDNYVHHPGDEFHIMRYVGVLVGEFDGLPDKRDFHVDNNRFFMDYGTRSDSAIVITAKAPSGSLLLVR